MGGALSVCACATILIVYLWSGRNDADDDTRIITATPPNFETLIAPEQSGLGLETIVRDGSGQYAFPIAADPRQFTWTLTHWDGTNAVDIEIGPAASRSDFDQLSRAQIVAVTNGALLNYSGSVGGLGYMLQGDDGIDYYYAHLSEQWLPGDRRVAAGEPLGLMGNTGSSAQYIEPHLHFAIGPRDTLWTQQAQINAAEWIQQKFGLGWADDPPANVTFDAPQGWPVQHPAISILIPFSEALDQGLPQPSIQLGFAGSVPTMPLDVIATLNGTVNVIRWTTAYGTRIQINNDPAQAAVVISGVDEWLVQDGDTVQRGQVIGRWNPSTSPALNYMLFLNSALADPTARLGE